MNWEAHTGDDYTVVMRSNETTDTASIRIFGEDAPALAATIAAFLNVEPPEEPRYDYEISDDGVMTVAPTWRRDNMGTWLRVTSASIEIEESEVAAWTDEQVQQADIWAWTTMLEASDNEGIQVPSKPDFLPDHAPFRGIVP